MSRALIVAREERNEAHNKQARAEVELETAQREIKRLVGELFRLGWGA